EVVRALRPGIWTTGPYLAKPAVPGPPAQTLRAARSDTCLSNWSLAFTPPAPCRRRGRKTFFSLSELTPELACDEMHNAAYRGESRSIRNESAPSCRAAI